MAYQTLRQLKHDATYPALPDAMQRFHIQELLRDVGHLVGVSVARRHILDTMISLTAPSDWTDPARDAVCYAAQTFVAEKANRSTKAIRDAETAFAAAGLITKTVADNGHRGIYAKGAIVHGLSFAPLISRVYELLEMRRDLEAARIRCQVLRRQCSAARRLLRLALLQLVEIAPLANCTAEALTCFAALPRRYDGMDESKLSALLATVENTLSDVHDYLSLQAKTSGTPEDTFRPYIQDTIEEEIELCNASSIQMEAPCRQVETISTNTTSLSTVRSLENKYAAEYRGHKPEITSSFTPRQIYAAAGPDFKLYLDAVKGNRLLPNPLDLVKAAIMLLPDLHINRSAWDEAVQIMGDLRASIAILVIDKNRHHPVRPIHSPGGALRAFARKASAGELNLDGSLIGILSRSRNG